MDAGREFSAGNTACEARFSALDAINVSIRILCPVVRWGNGPAAGLGGWSGRIGAKIALGRDI
jgi:hypothetical protein